MKRKRVNGDAKRDLEALAARAAKLTATLLELRRNALAASDAGQVAMIDAALADDDEAYARTLPGGASLPPAQLRALVALLALTRRSGGTPPTIAALAGEQRISKAAAYGLLDVLRKRGLVRHERYRHRSATVVGRVASDAVSAGPVRAEPPVS